MLLSTYSSLIGKNKLNESVAFLNSITFLVLVASLLLILISQLFLIFLCFYLLLDTTEMKVSYR